MWGWQCQNQRLGGSSLSFSPLLPLFHSLSHFPSTPFPLSQIRGWQFPHLYLSQSKLSHSLENGHSLCSEFNRFLSPRNDSVSIKKTITPFQFLPRISIYSNLKRWFSGSNYLPINHATEYYKNYVYLDILKSFLFSCKHFRSDS